jgi:hypothetical protein
VPGYLLDEDLLSSLGGLLKPEAPPDGQPAQYPDWILQTVADCNAEAYGAILSYWSRRGYTPQQLAIIYQGPTRQRRIGIYLVAERLGLLTNLAQALGKMPEDPRNALLTEDLTDADGNLILPQPTYPNPVAPVTGGRMQVDCHETFRERCGPYVPPGVVMPSSYCGRRYQWKPW